jgi:hypothetical protein
MPDPRRWNGWAPWVGAVTVVIMNLLGLAVFFVRLDDRVAELDRVISLGRAARIDLTKKVDEIYVMTKSSEVKLASVADRETHIEAKLDDHIKIDTMGIGHEVKSGDTR